MAKALPPRPIVAEHVDDADSTPSRIHWVMTSDCTAHLLWQGHVQAASIAEQSPKSKFTWLVSGCKTEQQKALYAPLLANPHGRVRHFGERAPELNGQKLKRFQASNRPMLIVDWVRQYPEDVGADEAVGVIDPDMFMLTALEFKGLPLAIGRHDMHTPFRHSGVDDLKPGTMVGQDAGIGAPWYNVRPSERSSICPADHSKCFGLSRQEASHRYGAGPPFMVHARDLPRIAREWEEGAVLLRLSSIGGFLSEQMAFGFAAQKQGLDGVLYRNFYLSDPADGAMHELAAWKWTLHLDIYDPCASRAPPPRGTPLQPGFYHMCQTAVVQDNGTRLAYHKDHVAKDILECQAPLLRHPSTDLLRKRREEGLSSDWRRTWLLCTMVNTVNAGLTRFKKKNCENPNLDRSYRLRPHAVGWMFSSGSSTWDLPRLMRKGGWGDQDKDVIGEGKIN